MTPVFLIRFDQSSSVRLYSLVISSTVEQVKQVFKRKENPDNFNWGAIGVKDEEEEAEVKEDEMKILAN